MTFYHVRVHWYRALKRAFYGRHNYVKSKQMFASVPLQLIESSVALEQRLSDEQHARALRTTLVLYSWSCFCWDRE